MDLLKACRLGGGEEALLRRPLLVGEFGGLIAWFMETFDTVISGDLTLEKWMGYRGKSEDADMVP